MELDVGIELVFSEQPRFELLCLEILLDHIWSQATEFVSVLAILLDLWNHLDVFKEVLTFAPPH